MSDRNDYADKANAVIRDIRSRIEGLEKEIDHLIEERRAEFSYTIEKHRARFEASVRRQHRQVKVGVLRFLARSRLLSIVTAPVIYAQVIPFALLDGFVTLFQHICFRAYGIRLVRRVDYMAIDRHQLAYLNVIEKMNCVFCGYANGVIGYVREVAARSEQYWCPIKHARRIRGTHDRYADFADFGDAEHYRARLHEMRTQLKELKKEI